MTAAGKIRKAIEELKSTRTDSRDDFWRVAGQIEGLQRALTLLSVEE